MKKLLIVLISFSLFFSGCTQNQEFPQNLKNNPEAFGDFMDMYNEDNVCPFECCEQSQQYYGKYCSSGECIDNKCVKEETQTEEKKELVLADNEVYPGMFIEILGFKEITEIYKEEYNSVGIYIMDEKRDGLIYGYEKGMKLILVELTVENKYLNAEYRRETFNNGYGLQFYLPNNSGERFIETIAPPQTKNPITEYYSDVPPINKGEKKEVFISFFVPNDYKISDLIMEQKDNYIPVDRTIEFNLQK